MKISIPPYVHSWPAPAVLVGCGTVAKPNLITIAWFGTVCSEPPHITISVRPSRFSFDLIKLSGEFTVNIPTVEQLNAVKLCGEKSGRHIDKFKELGWTPRLCPPLVAAPMVEECFLSLGCKVKHILPLGTHHSFISEVVCVYIEESLIRHQRRPDPKPESQLVWLDTKYWQLNKLDK
ncbi:MAG: flavin reductase family protein [Calditrichaeota bacterium]|nr:flavin reductase family protein [Calditrichota bacterium]